MEREGKILFSIVVGGDLVRDEWYKILGRVWFNRYLFKIVRI